MKNSLKLLDEVLNKKNYTKEDIIYLMSLKKPEYLEKLYKKAYEVKEKYIGKKADKNRKIYNGMMKTYFYQFMGPKPPRHNNSAGDGRRNTD